ncbi:MAG: DMT family transporter, partial [Phreatobacter sp.]|nr:DMT family transporter [Phreatobacter sp.]
TGSKAAGVVLAFAGIATAFGTAALARDEATYLTGDALMLLSGLCAALSSVFGRSTLMRHGPLFVTALAMVFAVVALLPVVVIKAGVVALPTFSAGGWLAILFLGSIAGAVQFSLYMWALRWLSPTTTTLYLTLNPITAMVLGIGFLGERPTLNLIVGMALVIAGILVGSGLVAAWRRAAPAGP